MNFRLTKMLLLLAAWSTLVPAVGAQERLKTLTRSELVGYLSKTLDLQLFTDLARHPSGFYPGTSDRIVPVFPNLPPHAPCSIDARYAEEIANGKTWARYQQVLRFISDARPKMLLDAVSIWGSWEMAEHLNRSRHVVADIKAIDPSIVVSAAPNEFINTGMTHIGNIPAHVWAAFGLPNERRPFACSRMRLGLTQKEYDAGFRGDIRQLETRMFLYWLATQYIDRGCESIMFSDVAALGSPTDNPQEWTQLVQLLRRYADASPAVRFVLFSGHGASGYYDASGDLLFDYHIEPLLPTERPLDTLYPVQANGGACTIEYAPDCPTLYGNGKGGRHPMGWMCARNPGLVFFDNYMNAQRDQPGSVFERWGLPHTTRRRRLWHCWNPYHFDEISWYALQTKAYRDSFLRYAHRRVRELDTNLHLALPVKRSVAAGTDAYQDYTCDGGEHYVKKEWWPAYYYALEPDTELFERPRTVGNYFFAPPDRTRLPLNGGYGQEAVIRELLESRRSP